MSQAAVIKAHQEQETIAVQTVTSWLSAVYNNSNRQPSKPRVYRQISPIFVIGSGDFISTGVGTPFILSDIIKFVNCEATFLLLSILFLLRNSDNIQEMVNSNTWDLLYCQF